MCQNEGCVLSDSACVVYAKNSEILLTTMNDCFSAVMVQQATKIGDDPANVDLICQAEMENAAGKLRQSLSFCSLLALISLIGRRS